MRFAKRAVLAARFHAAALATAEPPDLPAELRFRATLLRSSPLVMTNVQPDTSPSDSGEASGPGRRASGAAMLRPLGDSGAGPFGGAHGKPRVKMLATQGDLTPTGASFTPPAATPLPERGAGLNLFISVVAAFIAVIFLTLLASKL